MKTRAPQNLENFSFVSVIMPVRNEAAYIERSLRAVLAQTYPAARMEIVIADGMSTDDTRAVIERVAEKSPVPILVVDNPRKIAPTALNRALDKARGEIVVRVDGHCEIAPDYVANCVKHLQTGEIAAVGGPITTIGETRTARAIAAAMSSRFGVGDSAFRTVQDRAMFVDTVAFPGYTRAVLNRAGAFNEELVRNQDDEYNYRIRKAGGKILLAPDVCSLYYSRGTLLKLWRQYFQYGFWKVRVMQLHPRQMSARQFVPAVFVLTLIAAAILAAFSFYGKLALLILLTVYLSANLTASLVAAQNFGQIAILPVCFAILHFSYGFGFLKGLIVFSGRQAPVAAAQIALPEKNDSLLQKDSR